MKKLVRDLIPELVGPQAKIYVADEFEYKERLKQKLVEETEEFICDGNIEEIADILEVVDALCVVYDFSKEQVDRARQEKNRQRGKFEKRLVFES